MESCISEINFQKFSDTILSFSLNYKIINQLKNAISKIHPLYAEKWGLDLVTEDNIKLKVVGALILINRKYWTKDFEFMKNLVNQFSVSEDRHTRQCGINILEKLAIVNFNETRQFYSSLIASSSVQRRKVAMVTAKQIVQTSGYPDENKRELLDLILPTLKEVDPFIVTIRSETFEEGFMKYLTNSTIEWLQEIAKQSTDIKEMKSILNILGSKYLGKLIDQAFVIMDGFINNTNPEIKKARSVAFHNWAKYNENEVIDYLEERMESNHILDHWAELQADGVLQTSNL